MGEHMCSNLVKRSGLPGYAYDLHQAAVERIFEQGVNACDSIVDAAAQADVIFPSLPNRVEGNQVCFSAGGIIMSAGRASVIVDMSTNPAMIKLIEPKP